MSAAMAGAFRADFSVDCIHITAAMVSVNMQRYADVEDMPRAKRRKQSAVGANQLTLAASDVAQVRRLSAYAAKILRNTAANLIFVGSACKDCVSV